MKHLLSIESLGGDDLRGILALAKEMKAARNQRTQISLPLKGQIWALMFSKSSTRTRVSFEAGIRELGGDVMFLSAHEIQLGRGEPIKDTARVLGRMIQGAIIRTFAQQDVEEFAHFSGIPTINALTDQEHPCQILADLQTIDELLGSVEDRIVTFIGDGACNVPNSWLWAAARLGFELRIAAPKAFQPPPELIESLGKAKVIVTDDLEGAAKDADVLYTDVWVSMGKESESEYREAQLTRYRIDNHLIGLARPGALVMHCLPAYRGKEITEEALEAHAETIFTQAENRLHAQKAVLSLLSQR